MLKMALNRRAIILTSSAPVPKDADGDANTETTENAPRSIVDYDAEDEYELCHSIDVKPWHFCSSSPVGEV